MKTDSFIAKYLTKGETGKGYGLYRMVAESRGTDKKKIIAQIKKMPYEAFLATRYWHLVARQVKIDAGWSCECCGRRDGLIVHHTTYTTHGVEMYHLDDLQCLCRKCHEKLHGISHLPNAKN